VALASGLALALGARPAPALERARGQALRQAQPLQQAKVMPRLQELGRVWWQALALQQRLLARVPVPRLGQAIPL
jgi:hypothetical protein